jgi:hypothetical protein
MLIYVKITFTLEKKKKKIQTVRDLIIIFNAKYTTHTRTHTHIT